MKRSLGLLAPLVCEGGNISLGRIAFWIVLICTLRYEHLDSNWLILLGTLLTYNLGKKIIPTTHRKP